MNLIILIAVIGIPIVWLITWVVGMIRENDVVSLGTKIVEKMTSQDGEISYTDVKDCVNESLARIGKKKLEK